MKDKVTKKLFNWVPILNDTNLVKISVIKQKFLDQLNEIQPAMIPGSDTSIVGLAGAWVIFQRGDRVLKCRRHDFIDYAVANMAFKSGGGVPGDKTKMWDFASKEVDSLPQIFVD